MNATPTNPQQLQERLGRHAKRDGATDRQMDYLWDLLLAVEKDWPADQKEHVRNVLSDGITKAQASQWIERLKTLRSQMPREERPQPRNINQEPNTTEPEAGMYRTPDGTILRCYLGQKSGRMLVKRVVKDGEFDMQHGQHAEYRYEYVGAANGKAARVMASATRMTLDEAKHWGKMTGHCCVCARRLDVPESVEAGIGPVCAGRIGER